MAMMYGYGSGFGVFGLMHFFGSALAIALLVGLIFLVAWAVKTLKKDELLRWSVLLMVAAVVGWILMISLGGYWMKGYNRYDDSGLRVGPGMMWGAYDFRPQE